MIRHCMPFWRDDIAELEALIELWAGAEVDDWIATYTRAPLDKLTAVVFAPEDDQ